MTTENIAKRDAWMYGEDTGEFYEFSFLRDPQGYINTRENIPGGVLFRGKNMAGGESITLDQSFNLVEDWCEYPYRLVWVSWRLQAIVSYCEGDLTVEVFNDRVEFLLEVERSKIFYEGS